MKPAIALLILTISSSTIAAGADLMEEPAIAPAGTETVSPSADDALNALTQRLGLNDDQKSKVLPILVERRQKIRQVLADSSLRRRQKIAQMGGILEDSDKRINALLSPEQQKSYAVIEQEMKEQLKARHSRIATSAN